MTDAAVGISVLINSLGIIAVALTLAWMSRQHRRLSDEVTELQAIVDLILVDHDQPPVFAPRYDVEIVRVDDDD